METPERLQQQMKSMQDLHNIVSTMKALSAANIHQYEQAVISLTDYWHTVELGLHVVMRESNTQNTPNPKTGGQVAAVVFGSDHGMCGRFNEDITQYTLEHIQSIPSAHKPKILCIGLRAAEILKRSDHAADEVQELPAGANQISTSIQQILLTIDKWREDPDLTDLYVYHNHPINRASYKPSKFHLLPLHLNNLDTLEDGWPGPSLPTYTMDRDKLFSSLLNQYLLISLFRACAESQSAEHGSRLTAMQSAEKNLDEHMEELVGDYRRTRQEIITSELLDIIGSFEAMSGKKD